MGKSTNLSFFAAQSDQRAILDFIFSATDVRVFEVYSDCGADLREFHSTDDIASAFALGVDVDGSGYANILGLWSPSGMHEPVVERIELRPPTREGHAFRYQIGGAGLMRLDFGGVCGRVVTMSHFGHQSQTRAKKWGIDDGVNWKKIKSIANRIVYHIRTRLTVATVPGCPVLAEACQLAHNGYSLKFAVQMQYTYELEPPSQQS